MRMLPHRDSIRPFIYLILAILLWICLGVYAVQASEKTYGNILAVVLEVQDGDSIKVRIPGWPALVGESIGVRVYGVDTRELKTGARSAKNAVVSWLKPGSVIWLCNVRRDKYFRILADVSFDCDDLLLPSTCENLAAKLIEAKLGIPYFGGKKEDFPAGVK